MRHFQRQTFLLANSSHWNLFAYDAIALIATVVIQLSGGLNALGWGIVFVYLFFTIGFGYLLIPKVNFGLKNA